MTKLNSLKDLGPIFNIKMPKRKQEEVKKCPNCGGPLRSVEGTNIKVCDFSKLEDKKVAMKDGTIKEVQVFGKCGHVEIADVK